MGVMICCTIWIPENKIRLKTIKNKVHSLQEKRQQMLFGLRLLVKLHLLEVQQLLLAASAAVPELAAAEAVAAVAAGAEAGSLEAAAGSPLLSALLLRTQNVSGFLKGFDILWRL